MLIWIAFYIYDVNTMISIAAHVPLFTKSCYMLQKLRSSHTESYICNHAFQAFIKVKTVWRRTKAVLCCILMQSIHGKSWHLKGTCHGKQDFPCSFEIKEFNVCWCSHSQHKELFLVHKVHIDGKIMVYGKLYHHGINFRTMTVP